VHVLNATSTRGLAKRATDRLRALGYDVVDYDSRRRADSATTRIIPARGQQALAVRVSRALGAGRADVESDSLRRIELVVWLGTDWRDTPESRRP
jgi:hypothetical protein